MRIQDELVVEQGQQRRHGAAHLTDHLKNILNEEQKRARAGSIPTAAVPPTAKRKNFKELGSPTLQAAELEQLCIDDMNELKAAAIRERAARCHRTTRRCGRD